jgi:hypothetical protein
MKIGERTSRCFNGALPATRLRATATRLTTPLVDLLLGAFSLLLHDEAPEIAISTSQQFARTSQRGVSGLLSDLRQQGMTSDEPDVKGNIRVPCPSETHLHERLHGRF